MAGTLVERFCDFSRYVIAQRNFGLNEQTEEAKK